MINKINGAKSVKEWIEILKEKPKPEITEWGNWKLDKQYQVLEFVKDGKWEYEIDLERCKTPKETWNWVMQLNSKRWIARDDMANLIEALSYLIGYKGYWRNK